MKPSLFMLGLVPMALGGCLTAQTSKTMDEGLKALEGQHYSKAISTLGIPSQERVIDGKKVYTWRTGWNENLTVPTVNTARGFSGSSSISVTSYGTQTYNQSFDCRIDVMADKAGIITMTEFEGNVDGCRRYAMSLKAILPTQ